MSSSNLPAATALVLGAVLACSDSLIGQCVAPPVIRPPASNPPANNPPVSVPTPPAGPAAPAAPATPAPRGPVTGGPSAPSPAAPARPGPITPVGQPPSGPTTGPRTGGALPGAPARAGAAPRTGPRGAPIGADLTTWQLWWDFNQDSHLRQKQLPGPVTTGSDDFYLGATRATRRPVLWPDRAVVVADVLPALHRAVESGPRDVTVAGLLALGRIGLDHPEFEVFDVLVERLDDADQIVRETAALSVGLAGHTDPRSLDVLRAVVLREGVGQVARKLSDNDRTRSFAAYGIGLLAQGAKTTRQKRAAFEVLAQVLEDREENSRDVRVAAVQALSLLDIDHRKYAGARLQRDVLASLDRYLRADIGRDEQEIQAHCPTAIARLVQGDRMQRERFQVRLANVLSGRSYDGRKRKRPHHALAQSCALALGQMVDPDGQGAEVCRKALLDAWHNHKDAQTRNFAMLALGQIGGKAARDALLREFRRASASIERPWCALALGLLAADHYRTTGEVEAFAVEELSREFARAKNPQAVGAVAVALGLAHADKSMPALKRRLRMNLQKDDMAASICEALAMIGSLRAREVLHQVLVDCDRRPRLLEKASIALGHLGDDKVAQKLVQRLSAGEKNFAMQVSLATALAEVGDRRQVAPLLEVLSDTSRSAVTRAGAARALGGIADRRSLRWNTPLRSNTNYRANVATLTDSLSGVLDLK